MASFKAEGSSYTRRVLNSGLLEILGLWVQNVATGHGLHLDCHRGPPKHTHTALPGSVLALLQSILDAMVWLKTYTSNLVTLLKTPWGPPMAHIQRDSQAVPTLPLAPFPLLTTATRLP